MRRSLAVAVILVALVAFNLEGQTTSFTEFKSAFSTFADSMAGSLALNSTIGNTWSDAYIGGFPHFGVGLTLGSTFVSKDDTEKIFKELGQDVPSGLDQSGFPVPAIGAALKLGLPWLPMDVGIKVGFIPKSVGDSLENAYGVAADYKNIGLQLRYSLVKEKGFFTPDVSVGLGLNYQTGNISVPLGDSQSFTYNGDTFAMSKPKFELSWQSTTVDLSVQASKRILLIFTPYVGLGYTFGTAKVDGGVESTITDDLTPANKALLEAMGYDFSSGGFTYSTDSSSPVFRMYGGLSLNILVVLDLQFMYAPATKNFGASLGARFQL